VPARTRVWIALSVLMLFAAYWAPIRYTLAGRWLTDGNWSHGWLIPLFSLYFVSTKRDELARCRTRPTWWGAVIVALSLAVYFYSAWRLRMSYPQALSVVGAVFGLVLAFGGWSLIRVLWFPILFLVLAVPLPLTIYVDLTMPQQKLVSAVAAAVMPLVTPGLITEPQAVVIDYVMPGSPPGSLNVEEACSGMRSTMAIVTLGVALAYLGNRPTWQRLTMVVLCVPIAMFCNAIRVTITGLLYVNGYPDLAKGTAHQVLGIAMFAVALGLFALVGTVLNRLFVDEPGGDAHPDPV
jgi:exosortase